MPDERKVVATMCGAPVFDASLDDTPICDLCRRGAPRDGLGYHTWTDPGGRLGGQKCPRVR